MPAVIFSSSCSSPAPSQTSAATAPNTQSAASANTTVKAPTPSSSSAVPVAVSPANGAAVAVLTPTLVWNKSSGAVSYGLQIAIDQAFTNLVLNKSGLPDPQYTLQSGEILWNTTYYWRVNSLNASSGTSTWSAVRTFKTPGGPPPAAPTYLTTTRISSARIDLSWWDNSDNEQGFKIERMTEGGGFSQIATVGADVTTYSSVNLAGDTRYFYRVHAYNKAGNSDYSNTATAVTFPATPAAPVLVSPASGEVVYTLSPTLVWNTVTGATSYELQVATDSSFNDLIVDKKGIISRMYTLQYDEQLSWSTTYYWRVNSYNTVSGTSAWSGTMTFKTPAAISSIFFYTGHS